MAAATGARPPPSGGSEGVAGRQGSQQALPLEGLPKRRHGAGQARGGHPRPWPSRTRSRRHGAGQARGGHPRLHQGLRHGRAVGTGQGRHGAAAHRREATAAAPWQARASSHSSRRHGAATHRREAAARGRQEGGRQEGACGLAEEAEQAAAARHGRTRDGRRWHAGLLPTGARPLPSPGGQGGAEGVDTASTLVPMPHHRATAF